LALFSNLNYPMFCVRIAAFCLITFQSPEKNNFVIELFKKYGFEEYFKERDKSNGKNELSIAIKDFAEICADLFNLFGFSLRVQDQCFSQFSIVFRATPITKQIDSSILIILIALKNYDSESYHGYINGTSSASDIFELLKERGFTEDSESNKFIKSLLYFFSQREGEPQKIKELFIKIKNDA
jgi:hypothetical protein